jgi:hypothetical protein
MELLSAKSSTSKILGVWKHILGAMTRRKWNVMSAMNVQMKKHKDCSILSSS